MAFRSSPLPNTETHTADGTRRTALAQGAGRAFTRSRVRWTATTVLAAAAVITAIVLGNQAGRQSASPRPSHPTPTSSPLQVGEQLKSYVDPDRRRLYVDGVVVPGAWYGETRRGETTLGFLGEGGQGHLGIFWGTRRVGTLHDVVDDNVVVSRTGQTIAWLESSAGSVQLVVAAVTADSVHEVGRRSLDPVVLKTDSEAAEQVIDVDDHHTVTYGGVLGGHAWTPGQSPRTADITTFLTRAEGFPNSYYPPQMNPAGTWGAWPTDRDGRGHRDDSVGPYPAFTAQRPNQPDTRMTFSRPVAEGPLQWMYWESDDDLILAEGDSPESTTYLRCSVVTRRCELAPTPGRPEPLGSPHVPGSEQ
jgi:hypothetical protein